MGRHLRHLHESVLDELASHKRLVRTSPFSMKQDLPPQLVNGLVFGLLVYFSKQR